MKYLSNIWSPPISPSNATNEPTADPTNQVISQLFGVTSEPAKKDSLLSLFVPALPDDFEDVVPLELLLAHKKDVKFYLEKIILKMVNDGKEIPTLDSLIPNVKHFLIKTFHDDKKNKNLTTLDKNIEQILSEEEELKSKIESLESGMSTEKEHSGRLENIQKKVCTLKLAAEERKNKTMKKLKTRLKTLQKKMKQLRNEQRNNNYYGPNNRIFIEEKNLAMERDDLKKQINKMKIEEKNLQEYLMQKVLSPKIENLKTNLEIKLRQNKTRNINLEDDGFSTIEVSSFSPESDVSKSQYFSSTSSNTYDKKYIDDDFNSTFDSSYEYSSPVSTFYS
jgi:hypothetical protein